MNDTRLSDGRSQCATGREKRLVRAIAMAFVLAGFSASAIAQDTDIVGPMTDGVRCLAPGARGDLELNIKKLAAPADVIGVALGVIANDETRCQPMRDAANELVAVYAMATPAPVEDAAAATAGRLIDETLADADRKAASLKFEVGPPPRNMTKGRGSIPRSGL